jgi:methionyl-tRNA formyltransferase
MGTPAFAVPALEALADAGYDVVMVTTQPDRPGGRGKRLTPPAVKLAAEKRGIPVLQPETVRGNTQYEESVKSLAPDLIVVAAYGRILPYELLEIPRLGCINIHASLLPAYRGAAPIQRAIEAGETVSGVTLMYMAEALDAGDILKAQPVSIKGLTSGQATGILAEAGAKLLIETLPEILAGRVGRTPQDESQATYAAMIRKEEARLSFDGAARQIACKIRALSPSPGAWFMLGEAKVKALNASEAAEKDRASEAGPAVPGTVLDVNRDDILVATGDGTLALLELQAAGKKALPAAEFARGARVSAGMVLE